MIYISGPKPLKCFTPPPDYKEGQSESSEEEEEESEEEQDSEEDGIIRSSDKIEDESLKQVNLPPKYILDTTIPEHLNLPNILRF